MRETGASPWALLRTHNRALRLSLARRKFRTRTGGKADARVTHKSEKYKDERDVDATDGASHPADVDVDMGKA